MPTVLMDLDDTLLDHDSFTRFLNRLLRRNPVRLIAAAVLLPFVALLLARPRWKLRGASLLLWVATVGIRQTSLDAIVDRYVTDMRVRERLRQAGAEALDRHIQQGDTVVVVTASADLLALRLCVDIDPRIEVVASSLRRRFGGLVSGRHCHGRRKVEMLVERGLADEVVAAYGDSLADAPMLDLARKAFLINMSASTIARVRAALVRPEEIVEVTWPVVPKAGVVRPADSAP